MTTAFVSGATGYIAQHLIKLLLAHKYEVIGSVRSESKGEHLKTLFQSGFEYVVVADIVKKGAFDEVFIKHPDIEVFFHTASPFHTSDTDIENELLRPAVDGTINALESADKHGKHLKKFVLTSSFAAIGFSSVFGDKKTNPTRTITEDTWTELTWEQALENGLAGYLGSKALAERAAWDYVKEKKPSFVLTVVNPSYTFGPQAFDSEIKIDSLNRSSEMINEFLKLTPSDPLPATKAIFYDVRDVAQAHLVAFENKESDNQRLLLNAGPFSGQRIANIIHCHFPELKNTVPKGNPANEDLDNVTDGILDDSRTRKILKIDTINLENSIVDTVRQILDARR